MEQKSNASFLGKLKKAFSEEQQEPDEGFHKYAYLKYSYSHFQHFKDQLRWTGSYSVNVGDYVQAYIVKRLFLRLGYNDLISIDRDTMASYAGERAQLVCNAVMYDATIPNERIAPIMVGFNCTDDVKLIENNLEFFKKNAPIGCRDVYSKNKLAEYGVESFMTGCYSITLPKREHTPTKKKVFFVGVSEKFKAQIPEHMLENAEFIIQRKTYHHFPMTEEDMLTLEQDAINLLKRYESEATLVVSPLLHCISPCIGMGIPVVLARDEDIPRFSGIKKITPLYTPETWSQINWEPAVIDVEEAKANMIALLEGRLRDGVFNPDLMAYLNNFWA